jgi:hypothetical protein
MSTTPAKLHIVDVPHSGPPYGADTYFWCPGCNRSHGLRTSGPRPWTWNGSVDRPTFSPSVKVTWTRPTQTDICHSFVRDGTIQFLSDSTHALAGQTVVLPDWPPDYGANA